MSAPQDDALHIPIEIKTDDLKELQALIADIEKAEQDTRQIKPRKGRGRGDSTSRSPFESPFEEDEEFGILGDRRGGGALPSKGKDRTSKAAFDRKSEFAEMQDNLKEVQANQFNISSALGMTTQATGFAQLIGRGGGLTGVVSGIAQKAFLPLALITTITTTIKSVLDALLAPGAPFDRRFKRVVKDEVVSTLGRAKWICFGLYIYQFYL